MFFSCVFYNFFSYLNKPVGLAYAQEHHNGLSDSFLTVASSVASVSQCIFRAGTGYLYDKVGFRPIMFGIIAAGLATAMSGGPAVAYPWAYFFCIQMNAAVIAALFAVYPTPCSLTFGEERGSQVYTIVITFSTIAGFFTTLMIVTSYEMLGSQILYNIAAGFFVVAGMLNMCFSERLDIERLDAKGLIKWGPRLKK